MPIIDTLIASILAQVKEAGNLNLGWICNNIEDWIIIQRLGVVSRYPKSCSILKFHLNFLPRGSVKCNNDGSALGSSGLGGCGGIFRTSRAFTKACFSWGLGNCFSFEDDWLYHGCRKRFGVWLAQHLDRNRFNVRSQLIQ